MREKDSYKVGIYCRLSKEDKKRGKVDESLSIENQKKLLRDFVQGKGWELKEEHIYADDSFTGVNFERDDFKRLERDIKRGIIDCVVVKKIDRLGRGLRTGVFIEDNFVRNNVRFIALQENEDTLRGLSPMVDFYHAMNGLYPKQVSVAVRNIKQNRAKDGDFMNSQQAYGYNKSPEDYHKLVIDEYAAAIVRRVFQEFDGGDSARMIANRLNEEGENAPGYYHHIHAKKKRKKPYRCKNAWGSGTIMAMLRRPIYIGTMVQGQRQVACIIDKKFRKNAPEDWIVVENACEPIIERSLWDRVQSKLNGKRPRVYASKHTAKPGMFSGILRCSDCDSPLAYNMKHLKNGEKGYYRCSQYNNKGINACTPHYVEEPSLSAVVLAELRGHAVLSAASRDRLKTRLMSLLRKNQSLEAVEIQSNISRLTKRMETIDTTLMTLYEDRVAGDIPVEQYKRMSKEYERERSDIAVNMPKLLADFHELLETSSSVDDWLGMIDDCLNLEALRRQTVMGLIEKITIGERKKVEGQATTQEIVISYRFIGSLLHPTKDREDIAV
ncbi:MAG: recombinase family protein [Oscillospiraceae bacterium]|nr:recombinase family protein [Oscillospiraceae bacterium]